MDVIIVGSGLGGLCAGAKLAKEGRSILVLEQHSVPGGYSTTYRRKGYSFEIGLQETDGLDEQDTKTRIFTDLELGDEPVFVPISSATRFSIGGENCVVPAREEDALPFLLEAFPQEKKGIKRFFRIVEGLHSELLRLPMRRRNLIKSLPIFPFRYPFITRYLFTKIGPFLDRSIGSAVLKTLLMANLCYFDDDPKNLGLLYFAAGQGGFFRGSGYVRGGSQNLSNRLVELIEKEGGRVEFRSEVLEILLENRKICGVRYRQDGTIRVERADTVVSNASPLQVGRTLLPEGSGRRRLQRRLRFRRLSMSFTTISLAFRRPLGEIGVKHYKTLVVERRPASASEYRHQLSGDVARRPFAFFDYGQIDSNLCEVDRSYGIIIIPDRPESWRGLTKQEYRARKNLTSVAILDRLEAVYPGISQEVVFAEISTPLTMERYTKNPDGAVYGFSQNPGGAGLFRLPNKSPVPGLYFASAWTYPGGGFTGALWSGWSCAHEILRREDR